MLTHRKFIPTTVLVVITIIPFSDAPTKAKHFSLFPKLFQAVLGTGMILDPVVEPYYYLFTCLKSLSQEY